MMKNRNGTLTNVNLTMEIFYPFSHDCRLLGNQQIKYFLDARGYVQVIFVLFRTKNVNVTYVFRMQRVGLISMQ